MFNFGSSGTSEAEFTTRLTHDILRAVKLFKVHPQDVVVRARLGAMYTTAGTLMRGEGQDLFIRIVNAVLTEQEAQDAANAVSDAIDKLNSYISDGFNAPYKAFREKMENDQNDSDE